MKFIWFPILAILFTALNGMTQEPPPSTLDSLDDLSSSDELAISMEAYRLMYSLYENPSFPAFFFQTLRDAMVTDSSITFPEFERSLRKFNTGISLFAKPKELLRLEELVFQGKKLCLTYIVPNKETTPPDYFLHAEFGDPNEALRLMLTEFGIPDHEANLRNLQKAGVLQPCEIQ